MSKVGTPDLSSGVSRLNTLGKFKTFLKDLRLSVQKADMAENIVHFWNPLVFAFEYGADNTKVVHSVPVQAIHLRVRVSDHCGALPIRNLP